MTRALHHDPVYRSPHYEAGALLRRSLPSSPPRAIVLRRSTACQLPQASDGTSGAGQALGTYATRGIVRTIDANTMVIARGKSGLMTFSLTSSTHRAGVVVVGSTVSVRYREDGKNHVATAITLQRPKE